MENRYKSCRIIEGKPRWVILDENGKIINKNPNKEELRLIVTSTFIHNPTNTCDECKRRLLPRKSRREYDKNHNWTGRWLCQACWEKLDYRKRDYVIKDTKERYLSNFRFRNLDPNSPPGKGYIFQKLTCKVRGVKDLNIDNDNFKYPIDHSRDPEYGIIQSKGALPSTRIDFREVWVFAYHKIEHKKIFDNMFLYCADNKMENIIRLYIVPKKEIVKRTTIAIAKDQINGEGWYEKYRITDIKVYNDAYHQILRDIEEEKDPVLRKK